MKKYLYNPPDGSPYAVSIVELIDPAPLRAVVRVRVLEIRQEKYLDPLYKVGEEVQVTRGCLRSVYDPNELLKGIL